MQMSNETACRDRLESVSISTGEVSQGICSLGYTVGDRQIASRLNCSRKKVTRQRPEECHSKGETRNSRDVCVHVHEWRPRGFDSRHACRPSLILQNRCTSSISISFLLLITPIHRTHLLVLSLRFDYITLPLDRATMNLVVFDSPSIIIRNVRTSISGIPARCLTGFQVSIFAYMYVM